VSTAGAAPAAAPLGRRSELESLAVFLDAVAAGGAALVIEGEHGIGRSTLLAAGREQARGRGYVVLQSRPTPADAAMSFSGLDDLFHDVVDRVAPALPDPQRLAFEVALSLRDSNGEPPAPLAIALAVRGALEALSDSVPVVVAVDDLQWLDEPSTRALDHACRRLVRRPVGVLSVVLPRAHRAPLAFDDWADAGHLRVGPLSRSDIEAILRDRLGLSLTRGRLDRVHRASRGNPLAALEIGRAVLDAGESAWASPTLPVPDDLAEILRSRLAGLGEEVRAVLLVIAASSDPSPTLVETVAGGSSGALAVALDAGVIEQDAGGLRFTHTLFGSVLYGDADPADRRRLHAALADAVEEPDERAMHLALSADGSDPDVAEMVEEAARRTRARGAPSAAADLCEQAHALTPPDRPDDALRRRLLEAEYRLDAGELVRSRELLEELVGSSAPGPQRAAVLQRLGWVRYHQDGWASASDLFREAADEPALDPRLGAAVEIDRAVACQISGDLAGAAAHAAAAVERTALVDDPGIAAEAEAFAASVDFLMGRRVADEVMERAVEAETWGRPSPTAARPGVAYGVLLKWSDRLSASRVQLERSLHLAEERGAERSFPFILFHLAEVECWMGDPAAAERDADRAVDVAVRTGQDAGRAFGLAARALVAAHRGNEAETRSAAAEGLEIAAATGIVPAGLVLTSVLGFLELSLGRPTAAHRHLGPLMDAAAARGITEPGAARYLGDGLEALIGVGELGLAERVIADVHERSEELDRGWGSMIAARTKAMARSASRDPGGAREAVEEALAHNERLTQPLELGRTLLVRGSIERRDRQKRAARESFERSLEVFSELGAELWIERARTELGRIGGRAASGLELSTTEDRIARLVAEGSTNQEIAAALFLSVKTVEWNLSRIYRKLGIRSRTELARWVGPGTTGR
jgi:DNA-binding CsgD family transcriptional regulator